jgi:hypothetical protein
METLDRFPHLDQFLNGYMHQDWHLFGDSLQDVVLTYAQDTSPNDVINLQSEINEFIKLEGNKIEADYYRLFPNSVAPAGWDMKVDQWLHHVAGITARILPNPSVA